MVLFRWYDENICILVFFKKKELQTDKSYAFLSLFWLLRIYNQFLRFLNFSLNKEAYYYI